MQDSVDPSPGRRDERARRVLVAQARAEFKKRYREALGLDDVAVRFGVDSDACRRILCELVTAGVLRVTGDGRFAYCRTSHRYRC
jgi:hypothetical protein